VPDPPDVSTPFTKRRTAGKYFINSRTSVRGGLLGQLQQVPSAVGTGVGAVQGIVHGWVISVEN
jgi:hypothetical protein